MERAAQKVELPDTRLVLLRSAIVMSPDRGGVFDVLLRLVGLDSAARRATVDSMSRGSVGSTSSRRSSG
jgi:hypothetical protein